MSDHERDLRKHEKVMAHDKPLRSHDIVRAEGFAWNMADNDWTERVEYFARNRAEAENWIRFQRDWLKHLRILP